MSSDDQARSRKRLSRDDRRRQLLDMAWQLVREEGTDALSLGRLAEQAGVTKPVVYDHFETRNGLLVALYQEYDARQSQMLARALASCEASLASRARVIAEAYVDCVMSQGREIPGVSAALAGSPEMEALKRAYEQPFLDKCREALAGFSPSGNVGVAGMRLLVGAADALSQAAAAGELEAGQAKAELKAAIIAMVERQT
ncbi:TetR family transcriptional regulator [Pseudomonas sp. XWY-1]|jgi:AcrR family transcriptional regulator|uniref:TetR/AcrR family transcriptional regulator n=2 Tax=Pseudomonas TaxID=286 RepID=A0A8I1EDP1_PSEPU|nr:MULTISPECIES: TetR/AcrR family transcriptional regulator [Pseudomonas]QNV67093.1 TetR/AcrR family transcriptional regulator [Pseudomonas sp. CFA]AUZ60057.1 TetR family transcriptional regulator [Pseudomonas sp. XWY-1]MBI6884112.1 TetR/AcrR family transcriptional regulator [Pseudomonas putida]MCX2814061.1 TetR/AcrR family transcriptional regulator [Pseudomonas sp. DCB_E]MCX9140968.1 TetR/AcrR family transcriptional regulator [Pseudomonas sp. DCB_Q]